MSETSNTTIIEADGRDPVAVCAEVWQQGAFGAAPHPDALETCVLESGAVGVFPSSGTRACTRLGLAPVPASYRKKARRITELREAIVRHFGEPPSGASAGDGKWRGRDGSPRVGPARRRCSRVRDWRIEISGEGFTDERPCAEPTVDPVREVLTLIPVWR